MLLLYLEVICCEPLRLQLHHIAGSALARCRLRIWRGRVAVDMGGVTQIIDLKPAGYPARFSGAPHGVGYATT